MSTNTSRLSFAKVAASARKDNISFARIAGSTSRDSRKENPNSQQKNYLGNEIIYQPNGNLDCKTSLKEKKMSPDVKCINNDPQVLNNSEISKRDVKLLEAVKGLNVSSPLPNLVLNGSGLSISKSKNLTAGIYSDEAFQRADSGSELGTKPPSLDEKSITSGTTFAMDEKESLRPDDSASVKATEDDDGFSGRGSIVAGSRFGSEAATRTYRVQLYDALDRRNIPLVQEQRSQPTISAQTSSSLQQPLEDRKSKIISTPDMSEGFNLFYRQTPDEKLLEALESVKDRIFLLRLEQEVIEFVRSSNEPFIDLPPCNSFCRMLTHKLADYYHLTHQVDAVAGAVRIFRTPFCRLPPSLTSMSNPQTSGNTPPTATMKIMRRGGGDYGPSPSKAMSESGSDGKEKCLSAKEKLSREEREAAYNKARERIFGKEEKNGEAAPEIEEGNEISRSSSLSTKYRISQNKKSKPPKQRRDDSESFDSRSQYTPFFPQTQGPTWISSTQYSPIAPQPFNGNNRPFQTPLSPQYISSPPQFNPTMINTGSMQSLNMAQQYSTQTAQRFSPQNAPITNYGPPVQSPPIIPQQWSQPLYPSPYQQPLPPMRGPPNSIPYAFGQLPSTTNPADPKSQHPIPGSFNRHAFNPKTQSFVPGGIGMPMPQQTTPHGAPQFEPPHHNPPHQSYHPFNSSQQQFGNGMGFSMTRQNSNNSLSSYHASPLMSHRPLVHQPLPPSASQGIQHVVVPGMSLNHPQGMNMVHNNQLNNHLPNYGNPSTLPPKPPAGI